MEDTANLKSWDQAFEEYPISTTRKLERQLRSNIARDKDKLRGLVGGNYRDLLATAEQIVALDSQTQEAETQISNLIQSCKPAPYTTHQGPRDVKREQLTAELNLLHKCLSVTATVLKQSAVLLAARLLVISRLLLRSLSDTKPSLRSLESLRQVLTSLRRQLLRRVDSRLIDPRSKSTELIEAACSYCLATSCSSADAIQHFSHLRLETIRRRTLDVGQDSNNVKRTFDYFVKSLQTTKALLGRQLPEALNQLQKHPILRDSSITSVRTLNLDNLVLLISPEIYNFTPYISRSEIDNTKEHADVILESWSNKAFNLFIKGLQQVLDETKDLEVVMNLRTSIISTWLAVYFSINSKPGILETLRRTFNETVNNLIEHRTATFVKLGDDLVMSLPSNEASRNIWDPEFVAASVGKGASAFQSQLRTRHLGLAGSLRTHIKILADWAASVQEIQSRIQEIQRIRWRDKVEEADEDDEATTDIIVRSLTKADPEQYLAHLDHSLAKAISDFQVKLREAVTKVNNEDTSHSEALYLLRVIRETEQRLQPKFESVSLNELQEMIPLLQRKLAAEVAKRLSVAMETKRNFRAKPAEAGLTPSGLPSPSAFRALHKLCNIMAEVGGIDIWTEAAVSVVKGAARARIFDDKHKSFYVRNAFDEKYLRAALSTKSDPDGEPMNGEVEGRTKAVEYWSRTKLLFGLLA